VRLSSSNIKPSHSLIVLMLTVGNEVSKYQILYNSARLLMKRCRRKQIKPSSNHRSCFHLLESKHNFCHNWTQHLTTLILSKTKRTRAVTFIYW